MSAVIINIIVIFLNNNNNSSHCEIGPPVEWGETLKETSRSLLKSGDAQEIQHVPSILGRISADTNAMDCPCCGNGHLRFTKRK